MSQIVSFGSYMLDHMHIWSWVTWGVSWDPGIAIRHLGTVLDGFSHIPGGQCCSAERSGRWGWKALEAYVLTTCCHSSICRRWLLVEKRCPGRHLIGIFWGLSTTLAWRVGACSVRQHEGHSTSVVSSCGCSWAAWVKPAENSMSEDEPSSIDWSP